MTYNVRRHTEAADCDGPMDYGSELTVMNDRDLRYLLRRVKHQCRGNWHIFEDDQDGSTTHTFGYNTEDGYYRCTITVWPMGGAK